jgi:hypothetical protein
MFPKLHKIPLTNKTSLAGHSRKLVDLQMILEEWIKIKPMTQGLQLGSRLILKIQVLALLTLDLQVETTQLNKECLKTRCKEE